MRAPEVSVVVPIFRNADTLDELAERVRRVMEDEGWGYELIFVDDASPDSTRRVSEEIAARDPAVGVLGLARNVGQQRAAMVGLSYARGEWAVVMDGDLQDPPEAIPRLLAKAQGGFDAVFAGRRGHYEPWPRLFTSRVFKTLLHLLTGAPRDAGIYLALSRRMASTVLAYRGERPWLVALVGLSGLPLTSVPIVRQRRPRGRSAYSSLMRLEAGGAALWLAARLRWLPKATPPPAATDPDIVVWSGICRSCSPQPGE